MILYLEKSNQQENTHKFYRITLSINLFQDWQVDVEYGRISQYSRSWSRIFEREIDALRFFYSIMFEKTRKGYARVQGGEGIVFASRLITKRGQRLLDRRVLHFLGKDQKLRSLAKCLDGAGIIFVGQLVQLTEADIACISKAVIKNKTNSSVYLKNKDPRNGKPSSSEFLSLYHTLESRLISNGLGLSASTPNWRVPIHLLVFPSAPVRDAKPLRDETWNISTRRLRG